MTKVGGGGDDYDYHCWHTDSVKGTGR